MTQWKLVPAEPTPEMLRAIYWYDHLNPMDTDWADAYRIMLNAAPEAPSAEPVAKVRCACGDIYPADSYGAGYIDAAGCCPNCDTAPPVPSAEPVGHLHSNGDFCQDRPVDSAAWPVPLYLHPAPDHREVMRMALEAHDKRYQVVRDGYWWRVRIGDGTQTVGQHHTETGALRLASELHRAFHDGGFVVQAALCAALGERDA